MDGLTLQIYNWLVDTDEQETATFLNDCSIENVYIDTLFELGGGDRMTDMFDVIVYVPPKTYKQLDKFSNQISKIEEAIHDNAQGDNVHVRNIEWRPQIRTHEDRQTQQVSDEITEHLTEDYVRKKVNIMTNSIKTNPHLAIGSAKELIETCCKFILKENQIEINKDWDVQRLVKETNKIIDLVPFEVDDKEKVKIATSKVLAGFSNITHGVTELRNQFGSGHGHAPDFKELDELYAKLAVSASSELVRFYLTIEKMKKKNAS